MNEITKPGTTPSPVIRRRSISYMSIAVSVLMPLFIPPAMFPISLLLSAVPVLIFTIIAIGNLLRSNRFAMANKQSECKWYRDSLLLITCAFAILSLGFLGAIQVRYNNRILESQKMYDVMFVTHEALMDYQSDHRGCFPLTLQKLADGGYIKPEPNLSAADITGRLGMILYGSNRGARSGRNSIVIAVARIPQDPYGDPTRQYIESDGSLKDVPETDLPRFVADWNRKRAEHGLEPFDMRELAAPSGAELWNKFR